MSATVEGDLWATGTIQTGCRRLPPPPPPPLPAAAAVARRAARRCPPRATNPVPRMSAGAAAGAAAAAPLDADARYAVPHARPSLRRRLIKLWRELGGGAEPQPVPLREAVAHAAALWTGVLGELARGPNGAAVFRRVLVESVEEGRRVWEKRDGGYVLAEAAAAAVGRAAGAHVICLEGSATGETVDTVLATGALAPAAAGAAGAEGKASPAPPRVEERKSGLKRGAPTPARPKAVHFMPKTSCGLREWLRLDDRPPRTPPGAGEAGEAGAEAESAAGAGVSAGAGADACAAAAAAAGRASGTKSPPRQRWGPDSAQATREGATEGSVDAAEGLGAAVVSKGKLYNAAGGPPSWALCAAAVWRELGGDKRVVRMHEACDYAMEHYDRLCWSHKQHKNWKAVFKRSVVSSAEAGRCFLRVDSDGFKLKESVAKGKSSRRDVGGREDGEAEDSDPSYGCGDSSSSDSDAGSPRRPVAQRRAPSGVQGSKPGGKDPNAARSAGASPKRGGLCGKAMKPTWNEIAVAVWRRLKLGVAEEANMLQAEEHLELEENWDWFCWSKIRGPHWKGYFRRGVAEAVGIPRDPKCRLSSRLLERVPPPVDSVRGPMIPPLKRQKRDADVVAKTQDVVVVTPGVARPGAVAVIAHVGSSASVLEEPKNQGISPAVVSTLTASELAVSVAAFLVGYKVEFLEKYEKIRSALSSKFGSFETWLEGCGIVGSSDGIAVRDCAIGESEFLEVVVSALAEKNMSKLTPCQEFRVRQYYLLARDMF